jgi:hypothetical protein
METFVVRVWLPDRPGALGAVASRIGAVRGDVVGIDILERGADRVIDELVVELPDAGLVQLLVSEISQVDGVDVEEVRGATERVLDARLDALETAEGLVRATSVATVCEWLVTSAVRDFEAEWCVLAAPDGTPVEAIGAPPAPAWLHAFVEGSRYSDGSGPMAAGASGPHDVAWAPLPKVERALVVGRSGRPFRGRERRQLAALARIADHRWCQLDAGASVQPRERSSARRQSA